MRSENVNGEGPLIISTNKSLLNLKEIHTFIKKSYWAEEIPLQTLKKSIDKSFCFGVYRGNKQVGFARIITDYTTFAYITDVFILPEYQGSGLGKKLLKYIMEHPDLVGLRRWHLVTLDAQKLYKPFGFSTLTSPEQHMEIKCPDLYKK